MSTATPEVETQADAGEQHLVLYGVDWNQYVAVNEALSDRSGLRLIYIDGSLTFLTLSRRHDWFEDCFDKIIMVVSLHCGIEHEAAGSATLRAENETVGVEADRAYYFGPHAAIMRGPVDIDLSTQPTPDLAIEVEVANPADKAIATYARLGVPEVWRFDVRRKALSFLVLGPDGIYQKASRSRCLPLIGPEDVVEQLRLAEETDSFSRWFAQLNEWARTTILPRAIEG